MKFQNKKILLFLDNHSTHLISHDLSNVKLIYFPPTTTSVLQPLDEGIIRNFKHFYTKNIISSMISNLNESNIDDVKNISLLTAINFMKTAWSSVVNETILNCFKKAFFQNRTSEEIEHEIEYDYEDWNKLKQLTSVKYKSLSDFIAIHQDALINCDGLSDDQIIIRVKDDCKEVIEEEEYIDEEFQINNKPSSSEAFKYIQTLQNYFGLNNPETNHSLMVLQKALNEEQFKKLKQAKITDFYANPN